MGAGRKSFQKRPQIAAGPGVGEFGTLIRRLRSHAPTQCRATRRMPEWRLSGTPATRGSSGARELSRPRRAARNKRPAPASSIPPHQSRPCFRPCRTVRRLMAASASTFAKVSADEGSTPPLRSGRKRCSRLLRRTGPPPEGRDWRGRNDGGNNASAVNQRADAPDADRTDRSAGSDHQCPAGHAGRLGQPAKRAHQPAQHPQRIGATRSDAVIPVAHRACEACAVRRRRSVACPHHRKSRAFTLIGSM